MHTTLCPHWLAYFLNTALISVSLSKLHSSPGKRALSLLHVTGKSSPHLTVGRWWCLNLNPGGHTGKCSPLLPSKFRVSCACAPHTDHQDWTVWVLPISGLGQPVKTVHSSPGPENPINKVIKTCKQRGSRLHIRFKETRKTVQAIKVMHVWKTTKYLNTVTLKIHIVLSLRYDGGPK